ncbi:serine hydrolase [Fischerella thermalis WC542]|uniref:serine hydrolase n=1 Tax=Fischerella thermalis TaxID=372787 RepID=UPI000C802E56|nr:serine hydrolase [Fischerella thermalis]PLZ21538.1 serine hydrolase [Fischerella thermalis WC559]PLZ34081.1 serine hydrolase [Fischerella thermalis WC542]
METRTQIPGFSRPQLVSGRQKPPRKVQKSSQQQRPSAVGTKLTRVKASSTTTTATVAKKRPSIVVPAAIKPLPAKPGQIPPFKPSNAKVKTVKSPKQVPPKKVRTSRKTRLKPMARTMLYALRLLIVGIGIGAIVGTVLSALDPANQMTTTETSPQDAKSGQGQIQTIPTPTPAAVLSLSQEITSLKTNLQSLTSANANLTPGVFVVDLDNGSYVDINASASFPAASTIKIPILVAFFQDVDAGKIRLDEMLTMQKEMMVGGSGDMQYKPVGTQFKALEVATKMMTVSDNTATNMLIARMGGIEALNQRFRSWGLNTTVIRNQLPDLQGTNTTSPKELGTLMAMVSQGNLLNMASRDRILDIMRNTVRNHLLPTGLEQGATIAHKTGDIGTMLADAGLVDLPTGKRYIVTVMVQRPNNDPRAEKLIASISKATYQQFTQTAPTIQTPAPTPAPSITPNPAPTTSYQPQVITPAPLPTNTQPTINYQQYPLISPPLPNSMSNPLPATGYQYQPPLTNQPQYYYPPYTYPR